MTSDGRLAVVTAGASGIGLHTAEALARDGFRVVISDVDADSGARAAAGLGAEFRACDVRDEAQFEALFDGLGAVYALINNVGIAGPTAPLHEIDVAAWRDVIEVNLVSHFRACRLALPAMIEAGEGVVINMSSMFGRVAQQQRSPYVASKFGVIGLTKSLAHEVGPYGIRVNAICPGVVRGPRIESVIAGQAAAEGLSHDEATARFVGRQAIPRFVEPEEVADMIAYLVSDRAKIVTGEFIEVAGGFK